jgi:hypothetical protein
MYSDDSCEVFPTPSSREPSLYDDQETDSETETVYRFTMTDVPDDDDYEGGYEDKYEVVCRVEEPARIRRSDGRYARDWRDSMDDSLSNYSQCDDTPDLSPTSSC